MRQIAMALDVSVGYSVTYHGEHLLAIVAREEDDRRDFDERLLALADPLHKTLFAAAIAGVDTLRAIESGDEKEESFAVSLSLKAGEDSTGWYSKPLALADAKLSSSAAGVKGMDKEALAKCMAAVEAGTVAVIRDLLVANLMTRPLPTIAVGEDAERLLFIIDATTNAWDVAGEMNRAVEERQRAEEALTNARERLATAMGALQRAAGEGA